MFALVSRVRYRYSVSNIIIDLPCSLFSPIEDRDKREESNNKFTIFTKLGISQNKLPTKKSGDNWDLGFTIHHKRYDANESPLEGIFFFLIKTLKLEEVKLRIWRVKTLNLER